MRILHPTDFSEGADRARAVALRLARALSAELVLLHVLAPIAPESEEIAARDVLERVRAVRRAWAEAELERRTVEAHRAGVAVHGLLRAGEPSVEIAHAATDADLVVMGTAGRSGVGRLLVGSVADRVIRRARCPVLTVRQDAAARLAA